MNMLKKLNLNTVLIIISIIFALLYIRQCSKSYKLKELVSISYNNNSALNDSLKYYQSSNGSLIYEKGILISNRKELKRLNSDLKKELDYLKKNPKIIIKEGITIVDSFPIKSEVLTYPDDVIGIKWSHDTVYDIHNYYKLLGETCFTISDSGDVINPKSRVILSDIGISLTTALIKEDGNYKILATSNYPGFKISDIQGAIIDKKMITTDESSFIIGPAIGYGISLSSGGSISHGFNVGFNLTYNLNKQIKGIFRKGKLLK